EERPAPGATGLIAGFGPGITAEMALGTWAEDTARNLN
ncbi:type III polyketide synthase, partial [Streptomyces sp. NPDC020917]